MVLGIDFLRQRHRYSEIVPIISIFKFKDHYFGWLNFSGFVVTAAFFNLRSNLCTYMCKPFEFTSKRRKHQGKLRAGIAAEFISCYEAKYHSISHSHNKASPSGREKTLKLSSFPSAMAQSFKLDFQFVL